jgi:hypothetical protein
MLARKSVDREVAGGSLLKNASGGKEARFEQVAPKIGRRDRGRGSVPHQHQDNARAEPRQGLEGPDLAGLLAQDAVEPVERASRSESLFRAAAVDQAASGVRRCSSMVGPPRV